MKLRAIFILLFLCSKLEKASAQDFEFFNSYHNDVTLPINRDYIRTNKIQKLSIKLTLQGEGKTFVYDSSLIASFNSFGDLTGFADHFQKDTIISKLIYERGNLKHTIKILKSENRTDTFSFSTLLRDGFKYSSFYDSAYVEVAAAIYPVKNRLLLKGNKEYLSQPFSLTQYDQIEDNVLISYYYDRKKRLVEERMFSFSLNDLQSLSYPEKVKIYEYDFWGKLRIEKTITGNFEEKKYNNGLLKSVNRLDKKIEYSYKNGLLISARITYSNSNVCLAEFSYIR